MQLVKYVKKIPDKCQSWKYMHAFIGYGLLFSWAKIIIKTQGKREKKLLKLQQFVVVKKVFKKIKPNAS